MLKLVKTENGMVRGFQGNNTRISVFKGIPFAEPPTGKNRWRAPQPCKDWDGIFEADRFAPISVQDQPGVGTDIYCKEWHVDPDIEMNEDCLYLNVWTNAKTADDNLPVMVWFFGGGFQWGYPREMEFNGENIAKRGVIVVSVNYRLGAFGFLTHPEITAEAPEAPANFGLLDQQAGLKWVVRNIKNFGGDPNNITIAGQSAGGGSVFSHLTSETSVGLFQKAVIFSGIIETPYSKDNLISPKDISETEQFGIKLFEALGVKNLEEARKLDPDFIRETYSNMRNTTGMFLTPCVDHVFLTDTPFKNFLKGHHAHVPVFAGNTLDEFPSFISADSKESFIKQATEIFGDKTEKFLSFPEANVCYDNHLYAHCRGIESSVKAILTHNDKPSFYYSFEPDIPGEDNPGTFHSVDLWFFFETLAACWRPFDGHHYDLARNICNYLTNFIKTGDPNGNDANGSEMVRWNPYTESNKCEMHFTSEGPKTKLQSSEFVQFITDYLIEDALGITPEVVKKESNFYVPAVKKQAFNPYLPSWEYIPDGEPYVYGNRIYVYGSHDAFNGHAFCLNDYVCWSAPINDLGNWTYEGVTFCRTDDPANSKNRGCLYAPDMTIGPDGKYYLFYVLDCENFVSVAVSDTPTGKFKFLGYVHHEDGQLLGKREGDEAQFDPGVITIGEDTYLYTGFCSQGDKSRHGAMVTVLGPDMLTVKREPEFIVPSTPYSKGTEWENHAFFEAPSIRERNGIFYFIYSSEVMHELCYATSDNPLGAFKYGGVIVSNCDLHISSYKPADKPTAYGANNHGSIVQIGDDWYIFYHRQTNNDWYSRQGCAEKIEFEADGSIKQVEITSCGLNGGPLNDIDEYPAYLACNIFNDKCEKYVGVTGAAFVTQEGRDGDENLGYVRNICNGSTVGFKYFNCKNVTGITITTRGYGKGIFEVRTSIDGEVLAELPVDFCTAWTVAEAEMNLPDGVYPLYFTFKGDGNPSLKSFKFLH